MNSNVSALRGMGRLLLVLMTSLACSPLMAAPPASDSGVCLGDGPGDSHHPQGSKDEAHARPSPPPLFLSGVRPNEEQADRMFVIQHEFALQIHEKRRLLEKTMRALRDLPYTEKFDENQARVLATRAAGAMAELAVLEAKRDARLFAVLDADQRKVLAETGAPDGAHRHPPRLPGGDRPGR